MTHEELTDFAALVATYVKDAELELINSARDAIGVLDPGHAAFGRGRPELAVPDPRAAAKRLRLAVQEMNKARVSRATLERLQHS